MKWNDPRLHAELVDIQRSSTNHARELVDRARDPSHALHGLFEWDDAKAADEHRLHQAREVFRLCWTISAPASKPGAPIRHRVFVNAKHEGQYHRLEDLPTRPDLRVEYHHKLVRSMRAVCDRYSELEHFLEHNSELPRLIEAISDYVSGYEDAA